MWFTKVAFTNVKNIIVVSTRERFIDVEAVGTVDVVSDDSLEAVSLVKLVF